MKYKSEYNPDWQRKFALFPVYVNEQKEKVWLTHYYIRYIKHSPKKDNGYVCGEWQKICKDTYAELNNTLMSKVADKRKSFQDTLKD